MNGQRINQCAMGTAEVITNFAEIVMIRRLAGGEKG